MRAELQNEIDSARTQLGIPSADFQPLPFTTNWHKLAERIYERFCAISGKARPGWLWLALKEERKSIQLNVPPHTVLHHLVPADETVLLMAYDGDGFFFYEGKVLAIERVMLELTYRMEEYYLVSKKYEWLLCENHHDILIATGAFAIEQLRAFAARHPELLIGAYPA